VARSTKKPRWPAPVSEPALPIAELASTWIETDAYDRRTFETLQRDSPSLQALAASGAKLLPHFDGFLVDLFALLFKLNVVFRDASKVLPSAAFHRLLLDHLLAAPAFELLRHQTGLDETRSALATLLLGDRLLQLLRAERLLTRTEMLDFWNLEQQEGEIASRQAEAESAEELGQGAAAATQRQLDELAVRLRRQAEAGTRRLQQRVKEIRRTATDSLTRQQPSLDAETSRVARGMETVEEESSRWSREIGGGERGSAAQRIELGKRLANNAKLQKLARMVGRMREQALALRRTVFERGNDELFEVGRGNQLSRLLPCELSALRHPLLRRDFTRRYLDGELMQYSLRGVDDRGRGPMIVCLDGSSSMAGDKEIWAKAVTLTLLEIAQRQRRLFRAICFAAADTPLRILDLNRQRRFVAETEKIFELADYFPGGGTDFQVPLDAAVACLKEARYKRGDIVFITDGECGVDPGWLNRFREIKAKHDFRLLSVLIDVGPSSLGALRGLSDRITTITHLTSEAGAQIFVDV
jgi:uncharacterized protein with von Willebrand factor type A (vWA) domain